jgi:hypothetical protein
MEREFLTLDVAEGKNIYLEGKKTPEINVYGVVNVDKQELITVVHKDYRIVQHKDIAQSFVDACNQLNIKTKRRIWDAGNRFWMDVEFPDSRIGISKGEEFIVGFRLLNSYNKTSGVVIMPRLVRLACMNGMVVTSENFVKSFHYRHNQILVEQFAEYIEQALHETINSSAKLKKIVNECIGDSVEWQKLTILMDKMVKIKKHREAILAKLEKIDGEVTRWDLYNAFTNYVSHGANITPFLENYIQSKAVKLMNNSFEELMTARR